MRWDNQGSLLKPVNKLSSFLPTNMSKFFPKHTYNANDLHKQAVLITWSSVNNLFIQEENIPYKWLLFTHKCFCTLLGKHLCLRVKFECLVSHANSNCVRFKICIDSINYRLFSEAKQVLWVTSQRGKKEPVRTFMNFQLCHPDQLVHGHRL